MEDSVTLGTRTFEIGTSDLVYAQDLIEFDGTTIKITNTSLNTPLYARYAFSDKYEIVAAVPFITQTSKTEAGGVTTADTSVTGMGDPAIGGKMVFTKQNWTLAAALQSTIPAGKADFKQGVNITPLFSAGRAIGSWKLLTNLSYTMTGEYEDSNKIKIDTGDILGVSLGMSRTLERLGKLDLISEVVWSSFGESKVASLTQSGTNGTTLDLNVGACRQFGSICTKLGMTIALGEEKYRTHDYRVIAALTYLFAL